LSQSAAGVTGDGSSRDGSSGDGSSQDGASRDRVAGDGVAGEGAAGDGAAGDGVAGEGAAGNNAEDAIAKKPQPGLLNIANGLTVLRLALVPVFVWFLVEGGTSGRSVAFLAFALASVTDFLDGELARRRGLITDFGKIADPIADKALTGAALVTLSYLGALAWWVTVVIIVREVVVTLLRFWVIRHGVIAASRGGKVKTLLQIIAISLYVLPGDFDVAREVVMGAAVVVTLVTGVDYVIRAIRLRKAVSADGRAGPGAST
jgi:CDP-diacylglycerol---glycerol-3-phosphate 3-phosphatidyltransferase